jgi:hypothetical protein
MGKLDVRILENSPGNIYSRKWNKNVLRKFIICIYLFLSVAAIFSTDGVASVLYTCWLLLYLSDFYKLIEKFPTNLSRMVSFVSIIKSIYFYNVSSS